MHSQSKREKEKSLDFFADFFFQFLKLVPQAWRAPLADRGDDVGVACLPSTASIRV